MSSSASTAMSIALAEADKYEVLERIGSGSFGVIRKVKRKSDGEILCRKEISYMKMSAKERDQLTAEFNILSSLRHPNIVQYFHREHLKASQELYLYMEYCGGGDLGMVIKNLKATNSFADEDFVWRILSQLLTALYRCHYGMDSSDVGSKIYGPIPEKPAGLKGKQAQVMILHRDLKPENIFLGSDNSVKLGDFGLSKLMGSHDFASTYVGTPFYMSPEICAAEKYTLHSDIWAVGCIMYELCTKQPPFNAKTHIQLVQKIRDGRYVPLPDKYSQQLKDIIGSCLRVNPDHRPDTAKLLDHPNIRMMRRERELSALSRSLRTKEEIATVKVKELEQKLVKLEAGRVQMQAEIEATVRREWEVKARLEIDRQVQMELELLRKKFEFEVQEKVTAQLAKQRKARQPPNDETVAISLDRPFENSVSSASGEDSDFPSGTDLSELSLESPTARRQRPLKKETRTPFSRAKTTVDSPMDVQMADPSPITIASLSLSPRRSAAISSSAKTLFADGAALQRAKWEPTLAYSDDEDEIPELPSPTRPKIKPDPLKAPRRPILRHNTTALMQKLSSQPSLFPVGGSRLPPPGTVNTVITQSENRPPTAEGKPKSPNRRLSKIPSTANLGELTSPTRKNAAPKKANGGTEEIFKAVMQRNMGGRTLVELAQARAGGRPLEDVKRIQPEPSTHTSYGDFSDHEPAATWDPEIDEMPSPFLIRNKTIRVMR